MHAIGIGFARGPEAAEQRKFGIKTLHKLGLSSTNMDSSIQEEVQHLITYLKYAIKTVNFHAPM